MPDENSAVRYTLDVGWKRRPEIPEIKTKLSTIPYLKIVADGTSIIYQINSPLTSTIMFSNDGIRLDIYSTDTKSENKRKGVIYLLSILVATNYLIDVDLLKLYSDVIDCLSNIRELKESSSNADAYICRINAINKANLGLYYKILLLNKKCASLESETAIYKELCYKTMSKVVYSKDDISNYLKNMLNMPEPTAKKFINDYMLWCKNDTQ
ncbi:MAG: hypothetical protein M1562_02055 [Candidatus Marsarchaeota archaeon]|nr:hypothetical protein [Candidatus Marsarchaeota archaeon]